MGVRQRWQPCVWTAQLLKPWVRTLPGCVHQVAVHEHRSQTVWDRFVLAYTTGVFSSDGFPYVIAPAFSTPAFSTPAIFSTPAFSTPAFSTPAIYSCIFHCRIFSAPCIACFQVTGPRTSHRQNRCTPRLDTKVLTTSCAAVFLPETTSFSSSKYTNESVWEYSTLIVPRNLSVFVIFANGQC